MQTTANTEPEIEPDGQGDMEPVHLSEDSSNEYHASDHGEESEPDTEPDVEDLDSAGGTLSRTSTVQVVLYPDNFGGLKRLRDRETIS